MERKIRNLNLGVASYQLLLPHGRLPKADKLTPLTILMPYGKHLGHKYIQSINIYPTFYLLKMLFNLRILCPALVYENLRTISLIAGLKLQQDFKL